MWIYRNAKEDGNHYLGFSNHEKKVKHELELRLGLGFRGFRVVKVQGLGKLPRVSL